MRDGDGRLLRTYKDGEAKLNAYLEDHAFLLEALLDLYEATFEERWFVEARALADTIVERFADPERGGFFSTSSDHEALVARRKDLEDTPIPAGQSSAALGLLRLAALTGEHRYEEQASGVLRLLHEIAPKHPTSFGHLLQAMDFHLSAVREVALAGPPEGVAELARRRARGAAPAHRRRRRRGRRRRAAARGPRRGRRAGGGLRLRGLQLPAAGHRRAGAARAAGLRPGNRSTVESRATSAPHACWNVHHRDP